MGLQVSTNSQICFFHRTLLNPLRCYLKEPRFRISKSSSLPDRLSKRDKVPKKLQEVNEDPQKNRVYMWGFTVMGALGDQKFKSNIKAKYLHRPAFKVFPYNENVYDIACGLGFTLYSLELPSGNKLFGSGLNADGQIGYQSVRGLNHPLEVVYSMVPIKLPIPLRKKEIISKVAAGRTHSLALTTLGTIFAFGNNDFGQLGRKIVAEEDYTRFKPLFMPKIPCEGEEKVIDIVCGQEHSFFLTDFGRVYSCGNGSDGQTGLGTFKNISKPTLVEGDIKGEKIVKISSSTDTVLALNDKGEAFGWGNSEYMQIPLLEPVQQVTTPQHLPKLQSLGKLKDIVSSATVSMALSESSDVFVWGYGILGKGIDFNKSEEPSQIPNTLFGRNVYNTDVCVKSLFCGVQTLAAITNKDELFMWGRNKKGQLGLGHVHTQYYPMNVCIGARVMRVACGMDHTMAICRPF